MKIEELKQDPEQVQRRRQVLYWRVLAAMFDQRDAAPGLEAATHEIVDEVGLPELILDPHVGIDSLVKRYPELGEEFEHLVPDAEDVAAGDPHGFNDPGNPETLRRALLLSKLLLNVFGPNASRGKMTAKDYNQWLQDVGALERAFGYNPGELRSGRGGSKPGEQESGQGQGAGMMPGGAGENGQDSPEHGGLPNPAHGVSGYEISEEEIMKGLKAMEKDIIERMALREVLQDSKLAAKLTPSMALVEQLLRDKANLSGVALSNAKMLIKKYVDELGEVLKLEVEQMKVGKIDYSQPPKRVFSNLDLKRTIWKNLTNWDPKEQRLYVDQLFYKHTAAKTKVANQLIIVVDQSGSMLDSMVNCAILASIFAGLPRVEAHLIAYDTKSIDLTDWVHDPFEVLLRTNLGGGNDWHCAMEPARAKITQPKHTALVWISDFYEIDVEQLMSEFKALKESGVTILPVGSVASSGYFSVNQWFKQQFKALGTPVISGSVKTLIKEIKQFVATR